MLPLPDRDALLDLLDHVMSALDGRLSVRMGRHDCYADITQLQRTDSVLDDYRRNAEACASIGHDFGQLRFRHCRVGRVIERHHLSAIVRVANGSDEQRDSAELRRLNLFDQRRWIDRARDDRDSLHPPATGGMTAISSRPSMT